jgi:enamine deaminase RidA (YjgF/YER057c/UK114 family)
MKQHWQMGRPEEKTFGFAQAVAVGDTLYVSGQVGTNGDYRPADIESQMRIAYERIALVLAKAGATLDDVVDETIFVTDLATASHVAADVRREFYGESPIVASTFIGVAAIGNPAAAVPLQVEIKCTAVTGSRCVD